MPPSTPTPNNFAPEDNVWISRAEYDRLRTQGSQPVVQQTQVLDETLVKSDKVRSSRRRWQVILGSILALCLYISVASGNAANFLLVGAIAVFATTSLVDYMNSHKSDVVYGVTVPKVYKSNPYKILTITLLCVTVVPFVAMMGFFLLLFSMGGGEMGS